MPRQIHSCTPEKVTTRNFECWYTAFRRDSIQIFLWYLKGCQFDGSWASPMYQLMKDVRQSFNPRGFVSAVSGYYTTTDGKMFMPYNSSTPVLWVNKDLMKKAGLDPEMIYTKREKRTGCCKSERY